MTRPLEDLENVKVLYRRGVPTAEIARRTGVPRSTMRYWIAQGFRPMRRCVDVAECAISCSRVQSAPVGAYAYLLGLYLGDGCLSNNKRGVYRLRVTLDARYPGIIDECARAMVAVMPCNKVGRIVREGCIEVHSDSKHWVCLFPQHGSGPKHRRPILLEPWQRDAALERYPYLFLRGLIQSDGWRGTNRVPGGYEYSRYIFSNRSDDIRGLFETACDRMGISSRRSGQWQVAVSRRDDVARLDVFVGPKR